MSVVEVVLESVLDYFFASALVQQVSVKYADPAPRFLCALRCHAQRPVRTRWDSRCARLFALIRLRFIGAATV